MISYWPVMEAMLQRDCAAKENDPVNVHLEGEDREWQYQKRGIAGRLVYKFDEHWCGGSCCRVKRICTVCVNQMAANGERQGGDTGMYVV